MLRFTLTGRLVSDPELSTYGADDTAMARLRVASNQPGVEQTDFFDVAVFGDKAVTAISAAHKGDKVELRGTGRQGTWIADDGTRRERINLAASSVTHEPLQRTTTTTKAARSRSKNADAAAAR